MKSHSNSTATAANDSAETDGYTTLVQLFQQWRAFECPVMRDGIPDYSQTAMEARASTLPGWLARLDAIDHSGWPVAQQNDHRLVKAEMNGLDFNLRVLRPWARDPAFYVNVWPSRTDVPAREGPISYPEIELYRHSFPLSHAAQDELSAQLGMIPAILAGARINLHDSNARDLWVYGEQELRKQERALDALEKGTLTVSTLEGSQHADMTGAKPELLDAIAAARSATESFIAWLVELAPSKTGPSGVGRENYTWYQQNVHFVPFTWDEEVLLLRRELERSHASLKLEEHNNRNLPPLEPFENAGSFDSMAQSRLQKFVDFLVNNSIIPDKPYLTDALTPQLAHFVPKDHRMFFSHVTQREPMLLLSHCYHWIDLARMRDEPHSSPIRNAISLSNIWDTRAEGFATAFEEILMHAGLYDDNPRAKELVWIMLANRASRGLASLYVHANECTLERAGQYQGEWTQRSWANGGDELTAFEQLLYLRQPGFGTSYVIGKILLDRLVMKYAHQQELAGKRFVLSDFVDRMNNEGMIPMQLIESELITSDTSRL
jgi:hypothetical protein